MEIDRVDNLKASKLWHQTSYTSVALSKRLGLAALSDYLGSGTGRAFWEAAHWAAKGTQKQTTSTVSEIVANYYTGRAVCLTNAICLCVP